MTSKATRSIHVRLSDDADDELTVLALTTNRDKADLAREILHDSLLGRGWAFKVAARRALRLGLSGMEREP